MSSRARGSYMTACGRWWWRSRRPGSGDGASVARVGQRGTPDWRAEAAGAASAPRVLGQEYCRDSPGEEEEAVGKRIKGRQ